MVTSAANRPSIAAPRTTLDPSSRPGSITGIPQASAKLCTSGAFFAYPPEMLISWTVCPLALSVSTMWRVCSAMASSVKLVGHGPVTCPRPKPQMSPACANLLEDYDPSRSPVSYDVMYLPFPYIYGAMFGWDVPLRVDPLLLAMFLFLQNPPEGNDYLEWDGYKCQFVCNWRRRSRLVNSAVRHFARKLKFRVRPKKLESNGERRVRPTMEVWVKCVSLVNFVRVCIPVSSRRVVSRVSPRTTCTGFAPSLPVPSRQDTHGGLLS